MIIFADIDGRINSQTCQLASNFFKIIDIHPEVSLFFSNNWHIDMSNNDYFNIFGNYSNKIIWQTPDPSINLGDRELKILEFMDKYNINNFVAINDDCRVALFSQSCEWLFKVNYYDRNI